MRSINGVSYWKIVKGMIVTDNAPWKYSGMSTGCYEELVAHELGHAIGFGHAAARPALMYPAITADCGGRSGSIPLSSDDLAGMAALYPTRRLPRPAARHAPPGCAPPSPAPPSPSPGRRRPAAPRRRATGSTPAPRPACPMSASRARTTPRLVVPNVPDGIYYIRVVAVNPPAPARRRPTTPSTCGSPRPRRPRTRWRATAAGGNVLITWRPPSTGSAPPATGCSPGIPRASRTISSRSPARPRRRRRTAGDLLRPHRGRERRRGERAVHRADDRRAVAAGQPAIASGARDLRVVAMNGTSASPPSAETTVVVP